ncbi:MAG: Multidrug resistance protein MdtH [Candidatus Accumulibacter phosphatis]|jgi:sugar phosphate permease|uniref:Multidrug resistance protein MdtH n=1 Tax=Candidatus Accumulibacter phosphatis TaxID=327160 RepID=A0A084Y733_9PROT|nr:MAG: Multidrug resistance protein MdtH [Candidatus Accumulibacter phosphatis]
MFGSLRELPRTVWLLGLVSFFNDSTSELIYPLLPIYLASALMAGPKALGIIEGIAEATGSLLKLFSGVLSDRRRSAKPWVVGGYALAAIARPLLAFATSWPMLLLLRFADRVGKGLRTSPRDALLALTVDPARRGLAFGFHRSLDNAGAVVGPLLAAWLLAERVPLANILACSICCWG